ncbi:MAG: DNA primase [Bacteroidetes bacterium]|nr:MAG: DNA primase [Bacteroidota bacterium]
MIPQAIIDKVFDVALIEEVVGEYVTLKRSGANYKGLCPFHDDKSPSMSVSPSKGIFKCFSCQQGGNVFQFIMEHEGLSYPLAIKHLADKYNILIEEEDINVDELAAESRIKDGVYSCLEFAKNHFYERLNESQDGKVIYKPYLTERGINQQTIDKFSIGLSGTSRTHLLDEGLKNGYTVQQLYDAGLVKKIDEDQGVLEGNLRDTFIERIVFPIYSVSGKVLGFGGRIIKKDTKAPKYLNSPETVVYEKRKQLYGLSISKNEIRKVDQVFLVEGYMDVVSLNQSGVENVVAASGTAFTEEQARLIKRFTHNITMLFDGDVAGVNASIKHVRTLLSADLNVRIALFPADEDPDSFIQKKGTAEFQKYVSEKAQNFVQLIAEVTLGENKHDPIKKAEAARKIAENIAVLPDPLKRAAFINETATFLEIPERILIDEVNKFKLDNRKQKERDTRREERQSEQQGISDGLVPDFDYSPDFSEGFTPDALEKDAKNYQEMDLLVSLILYADREFDEEQNIAEYMFKELEESEIWPVSEEYAQIFKDAYEYFQEHKVLNELYFIRNLATSKLAAEVVSPKYKLSHGWEENFEKFVKTDEDNYKHKVVENLNYLKLKHIDILMLENQESLKSAETDEDILIYQHVHTNLQEMRKKITDKIGTVILR